MRERPILMSAPMVRAILAGTKTQTRRAIKPQPMPVSFGWELSGRGGAVAQWGEHIKDPRTVRTLCPYGQPGDRLWVKETFLPRPAGIDDMVIAYAADGSTRTLGAASGDVPDSALALYYRMFDRASRRMNSKQKPEARPSIYLPRWASRITLEIVSVRVERLQEISAADAKAEGIESSQIVSGRKPEPMMWRDYSQGRRDPFEDFSSPVDSYRTLWESINGAGSWAANPWVWVVEFRRVEA